MTSALCYIVKLWQVLEIDRYALKSSLVNWFGVAMEDSPTLRQDFPATSVPLPSSTSSPPISSPAKRQSVTFADQTTPKSPPLIQAFDVEDDRPQGLGIAFGGRTPSISRVPVGSRSPSSPATPSRHLLSSTTTPSASPNNSQSSPFLSPGTRGHGGYSYNDGVYTIEEEEIDLSTGQTSPYDTNSVERETAAGDRDDLDLNGNMAEEDFHKMGR